MSEDYYNSTQRRTRHSIFTLAEAFVAREQFEVRHVPGDGWWMLDIQSFEWARVSTEKVLDMAMKVVKEALRNDHDEGCWEGSSLFESRLDTIDAAEDVLRLAGAVAPIRTTISVVDPGGIPSTLADDQAVAS